MLIFKGFDGFFKDDYQGDILGFQYVLFIYYFLVLIIKKKME